MGLKNSETEREEWDKTSHTKIYAFTKSTMKFEPVKRYII